MRVWGRKISLRSFLLFYCFSLLLEHFFFATQVVFAAEDKEDQVRLVALVVDKNLYGGLESDIKWYVEEYASKVSPGLTFTVLPIDIQNIQAKDLVMMLENMYFDGVKNKTSSLEGVILMGNIPLPVVHTDGFVYPSIMPYVDFEKQQFVYNPNVDYFDRNNNPNSQPEIWHSWIVYDEISQYKEFFRKLKTYNNAPSNFVEKKIWYDDFIAFKDGFYTENTDYYINSFLYAEDFSYHRLSNLMLNLLKARQDQKTAQIGPQFNQSMEDNAQIPTLMLNYMIGEMMKDYKALISPNYLTTMRSNLEASMRRYTTSGEWTPYVDGHYNKILQRDNWLLRDNALLMEFNNKLEKVVDQKVMSLQTKINIPTKYQAGDNLYENFYFGKKASDLKTAEDLTFFRGTWQNYDITNALSASAPNLLKSVGATNNIFSQQIEANRAYNLNNIDPDLALYEPIEGLKKFTSSNYNGQALSRVWKHKDKKWKEKTSKSCISNDPYEGIPEGESAPIVQIGEGASEGGTEIITKNRGGATPLNLDDKMNLKYFFPHYARQPLFDIAGSKRVSNQAVNANSYLAYKDYSSFIQTKEEKGTSNKFLAYIYPRCISPSGDDGKDQSVLHRSYTYLGQTYPIWRTKDDNKTKLPAQGIYIVPKILGNFRTDNPISIDSIVKNVSPTNLQLGYEADRFGVGLPLHTLYANISSVLDDSLFSLAEYSSGVFDGMNNVKNYKSLVVNNVNTKIDLGQINTGNKTALANQWKQLILSGKSSAESDVDAIKTNLSGLHAFLIDSRDLVYRCKPTITNRCNDLEDDYSIYKTDGYSNTGYGSTLDISEIDGLLVQFAIPYGLYSLGKVNYGKIDFLSGWKTQLDSQSSQLKSKVNSFVSNYQSFKNDYQGLITIDGLISTLNSKKTSINQSQTCGTVPNTYACGCTYDYSVLCSALEDMKGYVNGLKTTFSSINLSTSITIEKQYLKKKQSFTSKFTSYLSEDQDDTVRESKATVDQTISTGVFAFLDEGFGFHTNTNYKEGIVKQSEDKKSIFSLFRGVNDVSNEPVTRVGMNQMTADRPIDNIRNVTFRPNGKNQDVVAKFNYPNLYNVNVFKQSGDVLVLKTVEEIRQAIDVYLTQTINEYNKQPLSSQIDSQLFKTFTNSQRDLVAQTLRYQNTPWKERSYVANAKVKDDIDNVYAGFDINNKISYIVDTYLKAGNNQGVFVTPEYSSTGYEVAYINSNGNDYIHVASDPLIVTEIKASQNTQLANALNFSQGQAIQGDMSAECGSQSSYLLFDLKGKPVSPWLEALSCWWKKTEQGAKFDMEFQGDKNPKEFWEELQRSFEDWKAGFTQKNDSTEADQKANQETIDRLSFGEQQTLVDAQSSFSIQLDPKGPWKVGDQSNKLFFKGDEDILNFATLSLISDGDVCVNVGNGANNLCNQSFDITSDSFLTGVVLESIGSKIGTSIITATLCLKANPKACYKKSVSIDFVPGGLSGLKLSMPTKVIMAGATIPIYPEAYDIYNNPISSLNGAYVVSVKSGDGSFYQGTGTQSPEIIEFHNKPVLFTAPKISGNKTIDFSIVGTDLLSSGTLNNTYTVEIKEGVLGLKFNGSHLTNLSTSWQLTGVGKDNLQSPKLVLSLKSKQDGSPLDNVVSVTAKNGLLNPGSIQNGAYVSASQFIIQSGNLELLLAPTYRAGQEELLIRVPGLDPITLRVDIAAGDPYKLVLQTPSTLYQTNQKFTGTVSVVDTWGNIVDKDVKIKLVALGSVVLDKPLSVVKGTTDFTAYLRNVGGGGYLISYLDGVGLNNQYPAYQQIFLKDTYLPEKDLNVMYLTLFGSDRGNQWKYLSDNQNYVPELMANSKKLLSVTTQLMDPSMLKKMSVVVDNRGKIKNLDEVDVRLVYENKKWYYDIVGQGKLGVASSLNLVAGDRDQLNNLDSYKDPTMIFLPYIEDDFVQARLMKEGLFWSGQMLMDFTVGTLLPGFTIELSEEKKEGYNMWNVSYQDQPLGQIIFIVPLSSSLTFKSSDVSRYALANAFVSSSTNVGIGWGVIDMQSVFEKQGYVSAEDSDDPALGLGFTAGFKNVTLFGNGESVGQASVPFASQFVVNFGDPLLKRISDSPQLADVPQDLGIGQEIYSDPAKSIFKVLVTDVNNDNLKDMLIVYTDGSVVLLKNYGSDQSRKNLQNLMTIAGGIKDIKVGDIDKNGYSDLLIWTNTHQIKVYTNNKGIFDVDGRLVCLNTSVDEGKVSDTPDVLDDIHNLFFEDMDGDKSLDLVTNDSIGDVKIFYGGSSKNGANYLSKLDYTCDEDWYERQKDNVKIVARFGFSVDTLAYVQDESLVHVQGWREPEEISDLGEVTDDDSPVPPPFGSLALAAEGSEPKIDAKSMLSAGVTSSLDASSQGFTESYIMNPLLSKPIYETMAGEDVGYKKIISLSGNTDISVYKNHVDLNGGMLVSGDWVRVDINFIGLKNGVKATYLENLVGAFVVPLSGNQISGLVYQGFSGVPVYSGDFGSEGEDYLFMFDNIQLSNRQKAKISYLTQYYGELSVSVDVKDTALKGVKDFDKVPDILVMPLDSCLKYKFIYYRNSSNNRSYTQFLDNLQQKIDSYVASQSKTTDDAMNTIPTFDSDTTPDSAMKSISDAGAGGVVESWKPNSLLEDALNGNINVSANMAALDEMTAGVQAGMDKALNGLCQGFSLGKGCQPPVPMNMIPFNQAYLAPGKYHIFGCQKLPVGKLEKGLPILFYPSTLTTTVGPVPSVGPWIGPMKQAPTDGFLGGVAGGIYPSQFRMYVAPTHTMQLGVAMCFGLYATAKALKSPVKDVGGNCIVTSVPLYACGDEDLGDQSATQVLDPSLVDATANGTCDGKPKQGNALVFAQNTYKNTPTVSSPYKLSIQSPGVGYPAPLIPQGGGLVNATMSHKPMKKADIDDNVSGKKGGGDFAFGSFEFREGQKITLKTLGGNVKGIMKDVVQDWFGRQIKFIMNNLSKFTISITFPDLSSLGEGLESIGQTDSGESVFKETRKISKEQRSSVVYNSDIANIASKQSLEVLSDAVSNPFESIATMFAQVPLVNIQTKEVVFKVPMIYTEDINAYISYLGTWLKTQKEILRRWISTIADLFSVCGNMSYEDIKVNMNGLEKVDKSFLDFALQEKVLSQSGYDSLLSSHQYQMSYMDKLIDNIDEQKKKYNVLLTNKEMAECLEYGGVIKDMRCIDKDSLGGDVVNLWQTMKNSIDGTAQRVKTIPYFAEMNRLYSNKKFRNSDSIEGFSSEYKERGDFVYKELNKLKTCGGVLGGIDDFMDFSSNMSQLTKNVQQNIVVLERYKEFPNQLYGWIHITDKYITDIVSLISNTFVFITTWLNTNAKIYSKYVDALILIISAIKTWQVLIDFSANWSKKCSKCTSDSYSSLNCALIPGGMKFDVLAIPPFKIPNIYLDFSHLDFGMSFELPEFVFQPTKIPLPKLPDLPKPPALDLTVGLNLNINLGDFSFSIPEIPVLPGPPSLPELPSFIPTVDFKLPTLPPAPTMPNIIPEISTVLEQAQILVKLFCIIKGGVGLVGEMGVKARIEQLSQRTWDIPYFDFIDQTNLWKKDKANMGFDYQMDAYVQFKMDFEFLFTFLDSIAEVVNGVSTSAVAVSQKFLEKNVNSPAAEYMQKAQDGINKFDVNLEFKTDLNLDTSNLQGLLYGTGTLAYDDFREQYASKLKQTQNMDLDPVLSTYFASTLSRVNDSTTVVPAYDQINEVKNTSLDILKGKQQEIRALAENIKDYDRFIESLSQGKLVADKKLDVQLSAPLYITDQKTLETLKTAESPLKSYLDMQARVSNGYLAALQSFGPTELGLSDDSHKQSLEYFTDLDQRMRGIYSTLGFEQNEKYFCATKTMDALASLDTKDSVSVSTDQPVYAQNGASSQPLLSQASAGGSSSTSTSPSYDLSAFVKGVWMDVKKGQDWKKYNVVASADYSNKFRDRYFLEDVNQDSGMDMVLRDQNSVYVKYAYVKSKLKSSSSSKLYVADPISSYEDLKNKSSGGGYIKFKEQESSLLDNLKLGSDPFDLKLVSSHQEVKDFKMAGQNFDTLKFSWSQSSSKVGDQVDGYLIKLNHRVDTYDTKQSLIDKIFGKNIEEIHQRYLLALPVDVDYKERKINFGKSFDDKKYIFDGKKYEIELIPDVLTGSLSGLVISLLPYEDSQETLAISIRDIPRNWQYASIVPLYFDEKKSLYEPSGPWSNQLVAGKQILDDTKGPELTPVLYRPATQQVIGTGNGLEGYLGTRYIVKGYWEDNLALSGMWIENLSGDLVRPLVKGTGQTGMIELIIDPQDEPMEASFVFVGEDVRGNIESETVTVNLIAPVISVKDVIEITPSSRRIIAELDQDIDQGQVYFQRLRNDIRKEITATKSNSGGGFDLNPGQTLVTGELFSFGNDLGFFDAAGKEIGIIRPDGYVALNSGFENQYQVQLDIKSGSPTLNIFDTKSNMVVFGFVLPKGEVKETMLHLKSQYTLFDLNEQFGTFAGGICLRGIDKNCMIYVSQDGSVYLPREYASSFTATYEFDGENVSYVFYDIQKRKVMTIQEKLHLYD